MPLEAKVLTYTTNTGTGIQDLIGTTFIPKGAIVWFTGNNTPDTFIEGSLFGFGFTDGTNSRCYCNVSEDAQATSDCARIARNDAIIVILNRTGTVGTIDGQASMVSWLSNGMRINWTDAPASAFKIHVLFFGGNDLTDVKVGDISVTANATVQYPIGFPPDCFLLVSGHTTAFNAAATDGTSFMLSGTGSTTRNITFRGGAGFCSEGARATMDTWQLMATAATFNSDINATTGAILNTSNIDSLDADGFTLTNSVFGTTTLKSYMAFKGGEFNISSVIEPGSTGVISVSNSAVMNNGCKGVMIWGIDTGTAGTVQVDSVFTLGAATKELDKPPSHAVTVIADLDNAADSVGTTRYQTNSVYLNITPNATATSSTVDDEASIDSFGNFGIYINWTNIGNARRYFFFCFGNSTQFYNPIEFGDTNLKFIKQTGGQGTIFG